MARLMNPEMSPDPLPTAWISLDLHDGTNVHIPEHHAEEILWRLKEQLGYNKRQKESADRMAGMMSLKPGEPVPSGLASRCISALLEDPPAASAHGKRVRSPFRSYDGRRVYEHDLIEHPHLPGVPCGTVIRIPDPFFEIPEQARWIVKYGERTEKPLSVMCSERYKGTIVTD